jgi:hypothetical protein
MSNDLRSNSHGVSIEKIIMTKQLTSSNCYQPVAEDPLDQYVDNVDRQGLADSSRLLMTNESFNNNLAKDFGLSKFNFSGIARPERDVSQSVLLSSESNLQKLSVNLLKGMNKETFNKRPIIHIKQAEIMNI